MPFPRQPEPFFWAEKERAWVQASATTSVRTALRGRHEGRPLAWWFHHCVRPPREPRLCAYCDGELGATSPAHIEHFVPVVRDRSLGLCWTNLFPSCSTCNTTYKRDAWVPTMIRPDKDWVVGWFLVNWKGELEPARVLDEPTSERIRLTINLLGLNAKARCISRRHILERAMELLDKLNSEPSRRLVKLKRLMKLLRGGPYRFVARQAVLNLTVGAQL